MLPARPAEHRFASVAGGGPLRLSIQPGRGKPACAMTTISEYEPGRFCWTDFTAHDKAAAAAWFSALFGWEVQDQDTKGGPPYAMFTKDGKVVAGLGQMSDEMKAAGVPPMWNAYVNVQDVARTVARAKDLGAEVVVDTMQVMDAGSLAFLKDPEGTAFALWQADAHPGAQLINEPGSFSWAELATRDAGQASSFYGELFGWSIVDVPGGHPYKIAKGNGADWAGILPMDERWGAMPSCWCTYFAVDDTDETCAKVEATGGKVMVPPTDIPYGRFAVVSEPHGGVFTVIKLADMPPA